MVPATWPMTPIWCSYNTVKIGEFRPKFTQHFLLKAGSRALADGVLSEAEAVRSWRRVSHDDA